ncbi:MAG: carbon-nitrogen hydrolase family protein [Marmoricola sp.]
MATLRVTLVQRAASLDAAENRAALDVVPPLAEDSDLVVLPEASARDFGEPGGDLAPYAEPVDGPYATRLAVVAGHATVVAGMFETGPDRARPYNTLVAAGPGGQRVYRKIHLYDSFGLRESDQLSAGPITPVVIDVVGWRVGLQTCYDLRFPELSRALVDQGAEVLVVPAAWVAGAGKVEHWRTLLRARAIENTAYVVAAAQPGPRYCGHSMVVAPDGDVLVETGQAGSVLTGELHRDRLAECRRTNPSLANRRM